MNRTVVDLVSAEPVGRAELADLGLHLVLQRLQPRELFHPPGQPFEIRDDQCAQRGIALRRGDPGVAVHVVGHGDRNVLHSFTVTRFMWPAPRAAQPGIGDRGPSANPHRAGASAMTRRTLTGATAGAVALLSVLLGTAVAYLATAAFFRS